MKTMTYKSFIEAFNARQPIPSFTLSNADRGEFLRCAEDDGRAIIGNTMIPMPNGMYLTFTPRVVWEGDPVTEWEFDLH